MPLYFSSPPLISLGISHRLAHRMDSVRTAHFSIKDRNGAPGATTRMKLPSQSSFLFLVNLISFSSPGSSGVWSGKKENVLVEDAHDTGIDLDGANQFEAVVTSLMSDTGDGVDFVVCV